MKNTNSVVLTTIFCLISTIFSACGEAPDNYIAPAEDTVTAQDAPILTADYIVPETQGKTDGGQPFYPSGPFPSDFPKKDDFRPDPNQIDYDHDGFLPADGDCDNFNPDVGPGYFDNCDNLNNDCDDEIDEGTAEEHVFCTKNFNGVPTQGLLWCVHWAEDGLTVAEIVCELDCQPEERCDDGADNDCDGEVDEGCPACDPTPEICDGLDNDCDGVVDDAYPPPPCATDDDCSCFDHECSYFNCFEGQCLAYGRDDDGDDSLACGDNPDCDDNDPTIHPGTQEICDGMDNDCDSETDEDDPHLNEYCTILVYYNEEKVVPSAGWLVCTTTYYDVKLLCQPLCQGAEYCNDYVDNDCDGEVDEGCEDDDDDDDCDRHQQQHGHGHHHHGQGHGHGHDCDDG